jgi:hypothetical protein
MTARLERTAVAAALFAALIALGSALSGTLLIDPARLVQFSPRASDAPARAHECADRATDAWVACSTNGAVKFTRCRIGSHPHGRPTYDCGRPDARPVLR